MGVSGPAGVAKFGIEPPEPGAPGGGAPGGGAGIVAAPGAASGGGASGAPTASEVRIAQHSPAAIFADRWLVILDMSG